MKKLTSTPILVCAAAIAAALSALSACGSKGPATIPILDVTKTYPAKTLTLQDIATVEYLPLETREGFLLDQYSQVKYLDDRMLVTNNGQGDIMIFDSSNGKALTSFNRHGRGPGEYPFPHIGHIAVDAEAGEMFVTLNSSGGEYFIYVYDLEGKSLRTIEFSRYKFPGFFHDFDPGHLFFLNTDTSRPELYSLVSKRDTTVTYLPVKFENRGTMSITQKDETGSMTYSRGDKISKTQEGYMISEPGIDTMFRWNKSTKKLTPVMAQTPSFHSMKYPVGMFYWAENSDFIFLTTYERKYDFDTNEGFKSVNLIYDKHSGEFFEGDILNSDYVDERAVRRYSPSSGVAAGKFVFNLQPYELLDLHEQGKLRGRLAEIAPTLKEDDNPVMMIVTFK
jgi:predicted small lipoprotein YifL